MTIAGGGDALGRGESSSEGSGVMSGPGGMSGLGVMSGPGVNLGSGHSPFMCAGGCCPAWLTRVVCECAVGRGAIACLSHVLPCMLGLDVAEPACVRMRTTWAGLHTTHMPGAQEEKGQNVGLPPAVWMRTTSSAMHECDA
jgi:hypothetical protein